MVAPLTSMVAAFVFCSPNDVASGLKVTNELYPVCSGGSSSLSSSIEDDHPKRRRRRTTSRQQNDTTNVESTTTTTSSMTNLISKEEGAPLKTFMDANAAQYDEAGNALADAAAALADEEETLARQFGLEIDDLEYAIDSMEGYYDDDDIDDGAGTLDATSDVHHHQPRAGISSAPSRDEDDVDDDISCMIPPQRSRRRQSPFPVMPSQLFASLAQSQCELLSNSLVHAITEGTTTKKIRSMVLYLPMENASTGRLEFVPAVTYPDSSIEQRGVFIASSSEAMRFRPDPKKLMRLPGFFKAGDLIPGYPFVSGGTTSLEEEEDGVNGGSVRLRRQREMFASASNDRHVSVSAVEEIPLSSMPGSSAHRTPPSSLSVSLFGGLDTLGVLVIWPTSSPHDIADVEFGWTWTSDDKLQVSRAARSLALALSMDNELTSSKLANENFRVTLADGMHQVKSPLQALRTFGKLLQRQLAESGGEMERGPTTRAMKLAEDIMSQGERVIDLIEPMDALIRSDPGGDADSKYLLRGDVKGKDQFLLLPTWDESSSTSSKLVPYQFALPPPMPIFGDLELEMTFPQDVLGTIVYASQAISRERGIKLDATGFDPDNDLPGVFVCVRHLTEAISNILDNAIKYAPLRRDEGGTQKGKRLVGRPRIPHIRVTLESNEPPLAPGATLYVEDNGPGIPSKEQDKVFLRGYRGQSCQDEVDGSGLGLAIAKEMITQMGGVLEILEEGPNRLDGTTLRVVLFRDPLNR